MRCVRERGFEGESKSLGQSYWKEEMGKSGQGETKGEVSDMLSLDVDAQVETISRHLERTGRINLGWL